MPSRVAVVETVEVVQVDDDVDDAPPPMYATVHDLAQLSDDDDSDAPPPPPESLHELNASID